MGGGSASPTIDRDAASDEVMLTPKSQVSSAASTPDLVRERQPPLVDHDHEHATAPAGSLTYFTGLARYITGWTWETVNNIWQRISTEVMVDKRIPRGLTADEVAVYQKLIEVVETRATSGVERPHLVVITDLAKDYDDLTAMVLLKELHRLGVVQLEGFVANMVPALKRACFGRGALDSLGLSHVPIAAGTVGAEDPSKLESYPYEFDCDFMANEERVQGEGGELLRALCEEAVEHKKKLKFLLISCLQDIDAFVASDASLFKSVIDNCVLQGGYTMSEKGKLEPDIGAANNRFHMPAAERFHTFLQDERIETSVYTKVAAFSCPLPPSLYTELADTEHPVGQYLKRVHIYQDVAFYKQACEPDPADRFVPFIDQEWFLRTRTSWYDEPHEPDAALPVGDEIIPYFTKVVVYDALAALGSSGDDALAALGVLLPQPATMHRIVGVDGAPGVRLPEMRTAITALLKGSLLACAQGLST